MAGENIARVADVRGADLLGNGTTQRVVGCVDYAQGETLWMENQGEWRFEPHAVNSQSRPIHTPVANYFGDGRLKVASLTSHAWEEVHLFDNLKGRRFKDTIIWGSTNEHHGSSGLIMADVNRDGWPGFVYAIGNAFDYARPWPRPLHGMQWIENMGGGRWIFRRVGDFPGAYGPSTADLNGDGYDDLVTVTPFNDWSNPNGVSIMAWINNGYHHFTPVSLAHSPMHSLTSAIADLDGHGIPEIITGRFHA